MKHKFSLLLSGAYLLLTVVTVLLLVGALGYHRDGPSTRSVVHVETMEASVDGGPWQEVRLPHSFTGLAPRTPVSLRATVHPQQGDSVYIKTVYAPAVVYFDGQPVFTFGKRENYPAFMKDPATELHIIETQSLGGSMELRIDFLSPNARPTLTVHPPMVGTVKELIMERSRALGFPLVFSMIQVGGGILLILISICLVFIDKKGILFLWMGLFSLSTGLWSFAENNFSGIIFRGSAGLYLLSFIGMFTFIMPLIRLTRSIISFEHPGFIRGMELFFALSAAIALLLQLTGLVPFSRSMYFFHLFLPPALVILTVLTVREYIRYKNTDARRYILPIAVLALSAFLELFNYQIPFTYVFSSLFQVGILIFLLLMGVTAGLSIKDSVDFKNRRKQLAFEQGLVDIQIEEQKQRGAILAQKEQLLRQQRHDLRHHLAAIQSLAREDNRELQGYLQGLMDQLPKSEERFCENRTVNAVISHYAAQCRKRGIDLQLQLVVPPTGDGISDSDLCVIFGNLLENAMEACGRMEGGEPFIRMKSSLQFDLLTITMDNSFNGQVTVENGRFRSSKRSDFGIGLASVRSMAQRAGGDVEFRAEGSTFYSSVYVKL